MRDTKLETLIAQLPLRSAPAGFRDRVLAAIDAGTPPAEMRARPSHAPYWFCAGGLALVAAAFMIHVAMLEPPSATRVVEREPSVVVTPYAKGRSQRMRTSAATGDTVVIQARGALALRVYRDGARVAGCPGDAGCTSDIGGLSLELPVTSHDTLRAIAYSVPLPPPRSGSIRSGDLDADLMLATSMGIKMTMVDIP